ncbi:LAMI_0A04588g1_1 [Lachancea mirantina]|uniref:LAMI_0A04588g1_1 n=1 Tax=Lachancea mirantina TaxID=1230905 RepID=A0A1G4IP30_9SACH|nr:LAMI_0A04588g1_1 [Lachancea mirantina]
MVPFTVVRAYSVSQQATRRLINFETSDLFAQSCRDNECLSQLANIIRKTQSDKISDLKPLKSSTINSDRSLPIPVFPRQEIFDQVDQDVAVQQWRKFPTKWFRFGKFVIKNYTSSLRNMWGLFKDTRVIHKEYRDFNKLVMSTSKTIEFAEIEAKVTKSPLKSLQLTRIQFQEYRRRGEFYKVPSFLLILLLFEEFTPALCYVFPSLVPWNCLTPSAYKKLSSKGANVNLHGDLTKSNEYLSPYNVPIDKAVEFLANKRVLSRWQTVFYRIAGNNDKIYEALAQYNQYLLVDDWLLLTHIFEAGTIDLSNRELINAIFERQLYNASEDLGTMIVNEQSRKTFLYRLMFYLAFRYNSTLRAGGDKQFTEAWGVNNIAILNIPGTSRFLEPRDLDKVK